MDILPVDFMERLNSIVPPAYLDGVIQSFGQKKKIALRINRCREGGDQIEKFLKDYDIAHSRIAWENSAFILEYEEDIDQLEDWISKGMVYRQGLSSMLIPVLLDPRPNQIVLDTCAAPGSKTTQMAALMENRGQIIALDRVKQRYYKLKSVLALLNAKIVEAKLMDARRYRSEVIQFDKILVDAPCSSEGRFSTLNKKSCQYWSLRKIKEMKKKQKGLLLHASRMLKPSGELVYSTCTFAPEENEEVVDWFLRKADGAIDLVDIDRSIFEGVQFYPAVLCWKKKMYTERIKKCMRILPTREMDGFFIAKFKRNG